jgi:hypothetical protein
MTEKEKKRQILKTKKKKFAYKFEKYIKNMIYYKMFKKDGWSHRMMTLYLNSKNVYYKEVFL